jgi:hypothetical protein
MACSKAHVGPNSACCPGAYGENEGGCAKAIDAAQIYHVCVTVSNCNSQMPEKHITNISAVRPLIGDEELLKRCIRYEISPNVGIT